MQIYNDTEVYDEFTFFGNEIGNIRIMKLNSNIKESKMDILISDHLSSISYIHCNTDLNLWISASIDGYINLYTLPLSKLLRSLNLMWFSLRADSLLFL